MKALIWDLDGTLVDSYKLIVAHTFKLFEPYVHLNKEEIYRAVTETSVMDYILKIAQECGADLEDIRTRYMALNEESQPKDYLLMNHVKEVLEALHKLGYTHFIYTHRGESTYDILEVNGVKDYFKEIITSADGFKRKPDSEALDFLIEKHDINKEISYYIGDRSLDVLCGEAAGLKTAFINSNGLENITADIVVDDILALLNFYK